MQPQFDLWQGRKRPPKVRRLIGDGGVSVLRNWFVENCGNTLILRCSAGEQGGTSHFASRLIGQREVMHTTESNTYQPGHFFPSTTMSEHRTIESAVMDSEIERLPDLAGFLKVASKPDWMRVKLSYVKYPVVFQQRRPATATEGDAPSPPILREGATPATPSGPAIAPARRPAPRKPKAQPDPRPPPLPSAESAPPPTTPVVPPGPADEGSLS